MACARQRMPAVRRPTSITYPNTRVFRPRAETWAGAVSSFAPNKANFRRFRAKNAGRDQKQTQSKPMGAGWRPETGDRRKSARTAPNKANWPRLSPLRLFETRESEAPNSKFEADLKHKGLKQWKPVASRYRRLGFREFYHSNLASGFDIRISCFPQCHRHLRAGFCFIPRRSWATLRVSTFANALHE